MAHTDEVYFESPEERMKFYDFKYYNHDTYDVSDDEYKLAEIYLRFDIDMIEHSRIVYNFYDYLESIGGLPEILKLIASMLVGTYCYFYATIMNIGSLYKVKTKDQ